MEMRIKEEMEKKYIDHLIHTKGKANKFNIIGIYFVIIHKM